MHETPPADGPASDDAARVAVVLPSEDLASVLPFPDLAAHVAPPLALPCVWSPNGMFIRVMLTNLAEAEISGVRITARTTGGQPLWMQAARDHDLTRIAPRSTIMMGVRTFDDAPGGLPLVIEVAYVPDRRVRFEEVLPDSAERYEPQPSCGGDEPRVAVSRRSPVPTGTRSARGRVHRGAHR